MTGPLLVVLLCGHALLQAHAGKPEPCWRRCPRGFEPGSKKDIGVCRGFGCAEGQEEAGGLCFTPCKQGYVADEDDWSTCAQTCPRGHSNNGTHCIQVFDVVVKEWYPRNTSLPQLACSGDLQLASEDGLCYRPCRKGYVGDGSNCYPECSKKGMARLEGGSTTASKCSEADKVRDANKKRYSRGSGKAISRWACPNPGHKLREGRCYSRCATGYRAAGSVCRRTTPGCPQGYKDVGDVCRRSAMASSRPKNTRYRMHGDVFPVCPDGLEMVWGACYEPCKAGFEPRGPKCVPEGLDATAPGTYERGPGSAPVMPSMDWCTKDLGWELIDGVCYMLCDPGYVPTDSSTPMCIEVCAAGEKDGGDICIKGPNVIDQSSFVSYSRGPGSPMEPVERLREPRRCTA